MSYLWCCCGSKSSDTICLARLFAKVDCELEGRAPTNILVMLSSKLEVDGDTIALASCDECGFSDLSLS